MDYRDYLESKPNVMLGKTVIKGTRLTVELILRKLSEGATNEDIKSMYPDLNNEQIKACITYAWAIVSNEVLVES